VEVVVTVAVSVNALPGLACTCAVTSTVSLWPLIRSDQSQVTVCPAIVHGADAVSGASLDGNVSVTTSLSASAGPVSVATNW
jgi:hypothetical protein